jgi:hypothetical protein
MSDKLAQLQTVLDQLSTSEAIALARAVELQRAMGEEKLPTDAILTRLRAHLQTQKPVRVPTLRRLVAAGFEEFLTGDEDDPRLPGLVPRATIEPWWRGLKRVVGPAVMERETQLRRLIAGGNSVHIPDFALEAQQDAAGWTRTLIDELRRPGSDPALKALAARPGRLADFADIAEILSIAEPLKDALDKILMHLRDLRRLDGRRIRELTPASVTEIKTYYLALNEAYGLRSRYLALAVLNRLAEPWHILRVGRALSWKPNDALVRDTEFGVIGTRLVLEIQRLSRDIVTITETPSGTPDCLVLTQRVSRYMDAVEGVVNEFGFRRDSEWGEAIMQSRTMAAEALHRALLDRIAQRVLDLMPLTRRPGSPRGFGEKANLAFHPDKPAIDAATAAARFLMLLVQRGQRHGLAHAARETLDQLDETIEERIVDLIGELKLAPQNDAIVAQCEAVAQACDIMYDDKRGALITRRMNLARRDSA